MDVTDIGVEALLNKCPLLHSLSIAELYIVPSPQHNEVFNKDAKEAQQVSSPRTPMITQ